MGETRFLPSAKGHTVAKRQLGYLCEFVSVRATETESLYQVSMHHRSSSAHAGDKCNLSSIYNNGAKAAERKQDSKDEVRAAWAQMLRYSEQ